MLGGNMSPAFLLSILGCSSEWYDSPSAPMVLTSAIILPLVQSCHMYWEPYRYLCPDFWANSFPHLLQSEWKYLMYTPSVVTVITSWTIFFSTNMSQCGNIYWTLPPGATIQIYGLQLSPPTKVKAYVLDISLWNHCPSGPHPSSSTTVRDCILGISPRCYGTDVDTTSIGCYWSDIWATSVPTYKSKGICTSRFGITAHLGPILPHLRQYKNVYRASPQLLLSRLWHHLKLIYNSAGTCTRPLPLMPLSRLYGLLHFHLYNSQSWHMYWYLVPLVIPLSHP